MGERLEGASRPGHFDGMLTVVAKLLHLTRPDLALYGQKDAQQLALIRRMVRDLNFGVEIVGVPTVREEDGLALSSRNRYLSTRERRTALALSQALFAGLDRHAAQEALRARAREVPATHARAEALSALGESARLPTPMPSPHPLPAAPRPSGPPPTWCWTTRPAPIRRWSWTTSPLSTRRTSPRSATTTPARPSSPSPPGSARPG